MRNTTLRSIFGFVVVGVAVASLAAPSVAAPPKNDKSAGDKDKAQVDEAPEVATLTPMMDGLKWGQSPKEIIEAYNAIGGIFDKDYDPLLTRTQPGVQQKALEADRDNRKLAVQNGLVEFKDIPTGYDQTPIKGEYTYRNKESVLLVERGGRKRYHFFIGAPARLWKIYDEVPLQESQLGKTFADAVTKLQASLGDKQGGQGVVGRVRAADPAKGLTTTTVDWQDAATHLRVMDRRHVVAVVLEDRQTLGNIERLRAVKTDDPLAMDPSILAITKGGISDPNSRPTPTPSASASGRRRGH